VISVKKFTLKVTSPDKSHCMEEDISILIADLSGYTALTETHGSISAADLIDKYIEIVNDALIGTSVLQEHVGDEVMIVASSPGDLFATAKVLLQRTLEQYNFLQIHGALHFGKLLKRNKKYFGSALNITSRIASQASAGTFLCSREFYDEVSHNATYQFRSIGKHSFKNVNEEKEIFELILENPDHYYIDPICRMIVNKEGSTFPHPNKADILFCSQRCLDIYLEKSDQE